MKAWDEARDRVNAAVQSEADAFTDDEVDGAAWMLADWVLVAKWVSPTDDRTYVSRVRGPGTDGLMMQGLLHEGLYGDWNSDEED